MTIANRIPTTIREKSRAYTPIKVKNAHKIARMATKNFKPIGTLILQVSL
jgi:hypothetical protein